MFELALGVWNGTLLVPGSSPILLIFNFIFINSYLKGYLDVPIQSVSKLAFDDIILQNDQITFNISLINAKFKGNFSMNDQTIYGLYEQNNVHLKLDLIKFKNISDYNVNRPQTPIRPFNYVEEEVKIQNIKANVTLAGTLTYLNNTEPIALVLLAHGSGGHDRDQTIYEHKSFMVIADHLTKHNIAVLRYDERGIAKSTGNFSSASDIDFAEDILSGIDFAHKHEKISNVKNVGVIGHSKGGATAIISKNMSDAVKFIVFLGAVGLDGESVLNLQSKLILKANNHSDYYIERVLRANNGVYQILKAESDVNIIKQKIINFYDNLITNSSELDAELYSEFKLASLDQLAGMVTPWFRSFLVFDPRPILKKTKIPILGLWGTHDLQVPAIENYNEMMKALEQAENKNFKLTILKDLNHLFQTSPTGNPNEYEKIEETFSVEALDIISDWILLPKNDFTPLNAFNTLTLIFLNLTLRYLI